MHATAPAPLRRPLGRALTVALLGVAVTALSGCGEEPDPLQEALEARKFYTIEVLGWALDTEHGMALVEYEVTNHGFTNLDQLTLEVRTRGAEGVEFEDRRQTIEVGEVEYGDTVRQTLRFETGGDAIEELGVQLRMELTPEDYPDYPEIASVLAGT